MSLSFKSSAIHLSNPTLYTILYSSLVSINEEHAIRSHIDGRTICYKVSKWIIKEYVVKDYCFVVLLKGRSQDSPSFLDTQSDLHTHYPIIFPPKVVR